MEKLKNKLWALLVVAFFFVFVICAFLQNTIITSHFYTEIDFLKSDILRANEVSIFVTFVSSCIVLVFAFIFTETLNITSIFPGLFTSAKKKIYLLVLSIFSIFSIYATNIYLVYYSISQKNEYLSSMAMLRGSAGDVSEPAVYSLINAFTFFLVGVYPWLLLSVPLGINYIRILLEANKNVTPRTKNGYKCVAAILLSLYLFQVFIGNVAIVFYKINLPFSEIVSSSSNFLGVQAPKLSALLYITMVVCAGITLIHLTSKKIFKNLFVINKSQLIYIGVLVVYISFLIGANVMFEAREQLMTESTLTMALLLTNDVNISLHERSLFDNMLLWSASNLNLLLLLLGAYMSKLLRCIILDKLSFKSHLTRHSS